MPKLKDRPKNSPVGKPAAKVLVAKDPELAKPKAPITTMKQAREEEENEQEAKSLRGVPGKMVTPEDHVVGSNYSIGNFFDLKWKDSKGNQLYVSLWYPTQRAAIDFPEDKAEFDIKTEAFKALKVPYIGILPGKPLKPDDARESLKAQGAKINI